MNRSVAIILIAIATLLGIFYLYLNSQGEKSIPQQAARHDTTPGGHQPVPQGQRTYEPEITSDTTNIRPNQPIKFSYKIKNDKGEILKKYEIAHEKIMHFIVVRKDLQNFQHLHPDFNQENDEFSIDISFPTDGPYRVFPDFTPSLDNPQKLPVTVFHDMEVGDMDQYTAQPVESKTQPSQEIGSYRITYELSPIMAGNEINYSLTIEKDNQPVTDLQTYLGALGHSVILKKDSLDFIHTHAGETGTGPKIKFATTLPQSGVYKIFTQFQHRNKVITTDYVTMVN